MPRTIINGVNLNYEDTGKGEAVVFLHGMTGSTRDWANQVSILSSKYMVITIDMRGHGHSEAPSEEEQYSIEMFADDVFDLLRTLGIGKYCLGGHSIGGFIALQFALEHHDMLTGLVLVDTSSGQFARDPEYTLHRQKLIEVARSEGMEAAFNYDLANNLMRIERFQKHPELREVSRRKVLTTSVDGYIYCGGAIEKWKSVTPRLSEIKVPTLIVYGDEDIAFIEPSRILKEEIADSELVIINGAGHNPHEEAPTIFNDALLDFLDRIKW